MLALVWSGTYTKQFSLTVWRKDYFNIFEITPVFSYKLNFTFTFLIAFILLLYICVSSIFFCL